MRLADRMAADRLGDGVRGRGAGPGARGDRPQRDPPRDRRARLRHAGQHPRGGQAGARRGLDPLRAVPRAARAARGDRRRRDRAPRLPATRTASSSCPAPSPSCSSRCSPCAGRRRGRLPRPGLPDLRVDGPLRRGDAGPVRDHARSATSGSTSTSSRARDRPDAPAHHQLAGEPDRRRAHARRHRADRRIADGAIPRSPSWPTRSTAGSSTTASTSRSRRCRAWRSGRSSSTASPRRTR